MVKKLTVLGIQLNNYGIRDSFLVGEKYFHDDALNVIRLVTMGDLVLGSKDEDVKRALEETDLCVIEDKTILEEAGVTAPGRISELQGHDFFLEFMRRVYKNGRSIFILGESKESIEKLSALLKEQYWHIEIAGSGIICEDEAVNEKTLNDINILVPDMVISVLGSPLLDRFLNERRSQIYAKLLIALDPGIIRGSKRGIRGFLNGIFEEGIFRRLVKEMGVLTDNGFQSDSSNDTGWIEGDSQDGSVRDGHGREGSGDDYS